MFSSSLIFLAAFLAASSPANALWPLPKQITAGTSALKIDSGSFKIDLSGISNAPSDLSDAASRIQDQLFGDKLAILAPDRGASNTDALGSAKTLPSLTLSVPSGTTLKSISEEAVDSLEARVESYTLNVPDDGSAATLSANSSLGLYRGLTTFAQLWYTLDNTTYTIQAPIAIQDSPAYPYRGLMLDTARNYFSVDDIKRTLDAMSWVKISTFHWHVVDSQSFPLVIPGFTELSEKAAYGPSLVYTEDDVKEIVSYAAARGIDVVAEIDTPGHTAAIANSHPEHIACPNFSPWATYANEPPSGQLRLASSATTNFTVNLLKAAAALFPSKHFSTGGDELNQKCYDADNQTQSDLASSGKTLAQALGDFVAATHDGLKEAGKSPVVWEEIVLDHNLTVPNETLVMVWISSANVAAVAAKGYQIVHAASDYFYLDCGHGAWVGDFPTGNSWCDPFKTWQKAYTFDPVANLTESQKSLIKGGQHLLWTEQSWGSNLDPTIWPRAAASAELFWTGAGGNVTSALPRLHDLTYRFNQRGVGAIALQPQWCALRPNACDLTA